MKARILIFSIAYEPLVGGAELAVRYITDRLPENTFDLITCRFGRQHRPQEKIGNVMVYRVGFGSRLGRYLYPALAARLALKLHRQRPYQLVWSIMAAYAGAAALLFLRRAPQTKFLLTLQEGDSPEHIRRRVTGFRKQWQQLFKRADHIQAISQFLARWASEEGATCPIEIVPNGVDLRKYNAKNAKLNANDANPSHFIIITTSRLVPKNGVDILIKAAAELKKLLPATSYQLLILGVGPEEEKLKKLVKALGLEGEVQFLGLVSADELPQFLARADIFVRPSRSEGLGTAFLEAMALGLPVVGTPVGGIVDFLKDGETGLFCQPEDPRALAEKIKFLMHKPDLRKSLGENGQRLVREKYDWDKIAAQMQEIFIKLA